MKAKLILLVCLILIASGAWGGFQSGCLWQLRQDEKSAVAANSGHYNARTADFEFGSAEQAQLASVGIDKPLEMPHRR